MSLDVHSRWFTVALCGIVVLGTIIPIQAADEIAPFNGKDVTGWVVEGQANYKESDQSKPVWFARDGMIHCAGKGFGFLRYDKSLDDFRIKLQYNMVKGCNSGVGIRSVKFTGPSETRPSFAGYELQILDDAKKTPTDHSSMSLYRYVAASANAVKPAGEWNTLEIECRGPKIKITLNGQVVQDVDQSKVESIKNKPLSGFFSLQNHGRAIQFRDISLEEFPAAKKSTAKP